MRSIVVGLISIGSACLPVAAQTVPRLNSVSATWFQRGTTNEVTLTGEGLGNVNAFLFSGTGLNGAVAPKPVPVVTLEGSGKGLSVGSSDASKTLVLQLAAGAESNLGGHEIRAAGPDGVSNPLAINISDLPEIAERKPDNTAAEAPLVTLPSAISGVIGGNAEADYIKFKARAGEHLIFDVQANRVGSPLDPALIIYDSAGRELARSEDANGLDPFLEFVPPADGEFVAKLYDTRFQGGGDYRYRMVAGQLPYLDFLYPFGGRRGSAVELKLKGRNLEGADKLGIRIAADATLGRQEIRAQTPRGHSNPQPFEAGDLPEFTESEPNNANDKANGVDVPVVINGMINEARDLDVFRFKAPADQKLVIDVQARRFGSPLDALLTLMDAKGGVLQRNDDANGPDARIEFDAKKDTEYLVSLRDLTDRGGDRFGYRMSVQPPNTTPDYTLRVAGGRFRVNQGGTVALRCEVERRNGFDGVVRINGDQLPAGVRASTLVLGPSPNYGWLLLSANANAAVGYSQISLTTSGESGGKALMHRAQFSEQAWLTILPPTAFTVDVAESSVILEQNGGTSVNVSITRRDGFNGEIKVSAEDLPGINIPAATIPGGQSRTKLMLNAAYNSEAGTRPLIVRAEANVDGVTVVQYAGSPVTVTTHGIAMFLTAMLPGSPFFRTDSFKLSAVALPTGTSSEANQTEFVVKVDRRGLSGEINLALEGLPAGVNPTVNNIAAEKNEAAIKLVVSDKAEAGKEFSFNVVGSATYNDRIWRQKTQPIKLMILAPEKEETPVKTAAAVATPPVPAPTAGAAK